jgi:hypothetical protein
MGLKKSKYFIFLAFALAGLAGCSSASGAKRPAEGINGVQPVEAWELNEGGTGSELYSIVKATDAAHKWGVWLNNLTFGRSLDFSTRGSVAWAKQTRINLKDDFTISLWCLAPPREKKDRVLLMVGNNYEANHKVFLDSEENHGLSYAAEGISGLENSGVSLTDSKWHHVVLSREGQVFTYYIDGSSVKTLNISGAPDCNSKDLYIGADSEGEDGFDGTIAELRVFAGALAPDQATQKTLDPRDNEPQQPRLAMHRGLVYDRRQYWTVEPGNNEGQTVRPQDIVNAKNMGFDHVKLLLTPNHLIDDNGHLIKQNMFYIERVVQYVVDNDYKCIVCLHPEKDFKPKYLGRIDNFELLVKWYGELAEYIGKRWSPDVVALQLMTEPGSNNPTVTWSWMSDRMWGAVRNVLPDHTIITSSDQYGNWERLKLMSPATDSNLVYSVTTYEPYTIGWYYYATDANSKTYWGYIKNIPYPVVEGVDYTQAIENAVEMVPDTQKATARGVLRAYVEGRYDGAQSNFKNHYDSLYNAQWHLLRAKSLDDWSKKYGGNIHMMCVEFGCMDRLTPGKLWKSAVEGSGIPDADRVQFVHDMRSAFDQYNIGWDYWSYNEAFSVFLPEKHVYGTSPSPEEAVKMFDWDMLEKGLGVTPLVPRP